MTQGRTLLVALLALLTAGYGLAAVGSADVKVPSPVEELPSVESHPPIGGVPGFASYTVTELPNGFDTSGTWRALNINGDDTCGSEALPASEFPGGMRYGGVPGLGTIYLGSNGQASFFFCYTFFTSQTICTLDWFFGLTGWCTLHVFTAGHGDLHTDQNADEDWFERVGLYEVDYRLVASRFGDSNADVNYNVNVKANGVLTFSYGEVDPEGLNAEGLYFGNGFGSPAFVYHPIVNNNGPTLLFGPNGVDLTPPLLTGSLFVGPPGLDGWFRGDGNLLLNAIDSGGAGMREIAVRDLTFGSGAWTRLPGSSVSFPVAGDGIHQIEVRPVDNSFNVAPSAIVEVKIDATPPVLSFDWTEPRHEDGLSSYVSSAALFTASATDATSGLRSLDCNQDGDPVDCASFNVLGDDAAHIVGAEAKDIAGNVAGGDITVLLDNTGPLVSILAPADGDLTTDDATVSTGAPVIPAGTRYIDVEVDAADPDLDDGNPGSGVARAEFFLDGALFAIDGDPSDGLAATVDVRNEDPGVHVICVSVFDNVENPTQDCQDIVLVTNPTLVQVLERAFDALDNPPI